MHSTLRASAPPGRYKVALSRDEDKPVDTRDTLEVDGPMVVKGKYRDFSGVRVAGGITTALGPLMGLWLAARSEKRCEPDEYSEYDLCTDAHPYVGHGLLLFAGSLATGIVLVTRRDKATLTVNPGVAQRRQPNQKAGMNEALEGLTVSGKF